MGLSQYRRAGVRLSSPASPREVKTWCHRVSEGRGECARSGGAGDEGGAWAVRQRGGRAAVSGRGRGRRAPTWRSPARLRLRVDVAAPSSPSPTPLNSLGATAKIMSNLPISAHLHWHCFRLSHHPFSLQQLQLQPNSSCPSPTEHLERFS